MQELPFGERSAKHILFHIFKQIVNYKKQDNTKGEVRRTLCSELYSTLQHGTAHLLFSLYIFPLTRLPSHLQHIMITIIMIVIMIVIK